jgi:hypothetical protein
VTATQVRQQRTCGKVRLRRINFVDRCNRCSSEQWKASVQVLGPQPGHGGYDSSGDYSIAANTAWAAEPLSRYADGRLTRPHGKLTLGISASQWIKNQVVDVLKRPQNAA